MSNVTLMSNVLKVFKVSNVEGVKSGVCSFYANAYRHTVYCIHAPLPSKREGSYAPCPVGLAVHHQAVQGGSFVLKFSGTCQNYKGDCRQDAQPIPNS